VSFADLEQRVNASAMQRLSNARALRVGAVSDFPVIFEQAYLEAQGVGASAPVATALDADVVGFATNSTQLTIRGATFTVRELQPDGSGFTAMVLEKA
jgi:hypothetical protein